MDCAPIFDKPIGDLNKTDVLKCLLPIWHVKPETARRTKQQMSRLFKYATARDLYAMANPVELAAPALGKQVDKVKSHKAGRGRTPRRSMRLWRSARLCPRELVSLPC
ncbi:phage integrase central domain-containing protein [Falsiruegeria litorea]|uniref:phage integrase central domain-containing protein n=1 Tax=Falsiruegeria litorea TaxID=1280831 RepID=UPI0035217640